MTEWPRISVVTSSYNQGQFIGRTIESVQAQEYPNLEHIVVDGLSTDDTQTVLARYPHLHVIREKDSGQAEAINKGFARATGQIFCFLNSDDTFEPGALHRVAREIDPAAGRHIVMGRCRFIDETDRFIGIEHPSAFTSHRRLLEIWKGYEIPQPAVFWTPEVWQRCGPLNEREQLVLDYDLFCRFSRLYAFHTFDQIVANYRLHAESKTQGVDDAQRLDQAVRVSRRYWGSAWSSHGAAIRTSYALHRFDRRGRGYRHLQASRQRWREGRRIAAVAPLLQGSILAPEVGLHALLPPLRRYVGPYVRGIAARLTKRQGRQMSPQTLAWQGFSSLHADGWAGPRLEQELDVADGQHTLRFAGDTIPERLPTPLKLDLLVDDRVVGALSPDGQAQFEVALNLPDLAPGRHRLGIRANTFMVPHEVWGNGDYRPLSFRLRTLTFARQDFTGERTHEGL